MILVNLGFRPRIKFIKRTSQKGINGYIKNNQYGVQLSTNDTNKLLNSILEYPELKKVYEDKRCLRRQSKQASNTSFSNGNYISTIIKDIESYDWEGDVYNIEVEDDHSYIANGEIVSNCDSLRYVTSSLSRVRFLTACSGNEREANKIMKNY